MDYEGFVAKRITALRQAKDVSARDMSLSIGQNVNYINHIEKRKTEPSLTGLVYICEYLNITPHEFFDEGNPYPERIRGIVENIKRLEDNALKALAVIVEEMVTKK